MITNDEYDKLKAIRRKLSLKDRQLVSAFLVEIDIAQNTWRNEREYRRIERQLANAEARLKRELAAEARAKRLAQEEADFMASLIAQMEGR